MFAKLCWLAVALTLQTGSSIAAGAGDAFDTGRKQFAAGDFRAAVASFRTAAAGIDKAEHPSRFGTVLYNLAVAHHAAGQYRLAFEVLKAAAAAARDADDRALESKILALHGTVATYSRKADAAGEYFEEALADPSNLDPATLASVNNDYGVMLSGRLEMGGNATVDVEAASARFAKAENLATKLGMAELAAKVALNRAMMHLAAAGFYLDNGGGAAAEFDKRGDEAYQASLKSAAADLGVAATRGAQLSPNYAKANLLLTIGDAYRSLGRAGTTFVTGHSERSFEAYQKALATARKVGDPGAMSFALGKMGRLYEEAGRRDEALALTRQARAEAERAKSADALYQWEWQIGRLLTASGDRAAALSAYRRAKHVLGKIRHDVAIGFGNRHLGGSFRESVGGLYFEMADLILSSADGERERDQIQSLYSEAREVVESFKSAELEDFFQDECVNLALAASKDVEEIDPKTAVFYVIPLAERTEVLVSQGGKIHRFTSPVPGDQLDEDATRLRHYLEMDGNPSFFQYAQKIYDTVIRPAEALLKKAAVDTLVFVPDGSLRTVPMAALHDGESFVVEKWAVAVTPGLRLMEPNRVPRENVQMLVGALSEAVQGMAALPSVEGEVAAIRAQIDPTPTFFENAKFLKKAFSEAVQKNPYQIVQIASHGEFGRSAKDSYLLTYDSRIDLNELEAIIRPRKYVGQPVELLALSACRTAAGDDRAALGLAGIAVKSGARSAFATLWYVYDEITGALTADFYRRLLEDPELSKAEALRRAQVEYLKDPRYAHPRAWAPYIIIGNWL